MKGSDVISAKGIYGTLGVPNASNTPGCRNGALNWTDLNGNLWLYGGIGKDSTYLSSGALSDLWKFDILLGQWVWIKGSPIQNTAYLPVYGTQGIAAPANTPGSRVSSATWVDNQGNLCLFGGSSYTTNLVASCGKNDIWKYNITTGMWTWINGATSCNPVASYGIKGVMTATNIPGARSVMNYWKDTTGNLWIFGGYGIINSATNSFLNDLWKYDAGLNQWVWLNGTNSFTQTGVYGTMGSGSAVTTPGARNASFSWIDKTGILWLYGGGGVDATGSLGELSDLWKYNTLTNQWTWMKGPTLKDQVPVYGIQNIFSAANHPGAMNGNACWVDSTGNTLWLANAGAANPTNSGLFVNTMWKYDIAANQWTWTKGVNTFTNQFGVYGTMGVPAITNIPGGRYNCNAWQGKNGEFWLFGGVGLDTACCGGILNDLWRFNPCYVTVNTITNTTNPANYTICANATTSLSAVSSGTVSWYDINSNLIATGNTLSIPAPSVSSTFIIGDNVSCRPISVMLTVLPAPALSISATNTFICQGGSATLTALSGTNSYSWSNGSTNSITSVSPGFTSIYSVVVTNSTSGCTTTGIKTVSVFPTPGLTITATPTMICQGNTATLTALSGASSYSWSNGSTNSIIAVMPNVTSSYSVLVTASPLGCSNTGIRTISVSPRPALTIISTNTAICQGDTITLTALSGASSYSWSNGSTGSITSVAPAATSAYSVLVTDTVSGCTNNGVKTISVSPTPTLAITSTTFIICQGSSVTLTALSGAGTYSWSNGSTNYITTVAPGVTSTYSVVVSNYPSGCAASGVKTIYVNPLPAINIITSNSLICIGETATLNVTGANSYTWSTGFNGNSVTVSPTVTTIYTATGADLNGCQNSSAFTQSISICEGETEMSLTEKSIYVYPNPFHASIWIVAPSGYNVEVFNALGNSVKKIIQNKAMQEIDLGDQPSGVYFIRIGFTVKKIIKE